MASPVQMPVPATQQREVQVDDDTLVRIVEVGDGSVDVDLSDPEPEEAGPGEVVGDNLATGMEEQQLAALTTVLEEGILADIESRSEWVEDYKKGLKLLGLRYEPPRDGDLSSVRHPLLLHSVVRFQAQARGELLPAAGPVKVAIDGDETEELQTMAEDLETDMNHWLTTTATEYYPDTDRGLFYLGYGGTIFKKVFWCPVRRRPVSETVYASDLIVSQDTTDLGNSLRTTHQVEMSQQRMTELMGLGHYRRVALSTPTGDADDIRAEEQRISGIDTGTPRIEDAPHVVWECYTRLDPDEYGIPERPEGHEDGDVAPYVVTLERDSRRVLAIRANWVSERPSETRRWFVKFGLIPGMGFLDYGYVHLLGNYTRSLTAILRMMVDAGMFANFPGGVRAKGKRMENNVLRPMPGEFPEIDTGGMPLRDSLMPLPYQGPSQELLALYKEIEQAALGMAGVVSLETGEGRTNVPVGTIMANIEQQTQVISAVHKRLHTAQEEEFELLRDLFREDPSSLNREDGARQWTADDLSRLALRPASDPNVPAHVHRLMQATALEMLSQQKPHLYNHYEVERRVLRIIGVSDIDAILPDPVEVAAASPPQEDPQAQLIRMEQQIRMAELQLRAREGDRKAEIEMAKLRAQMQRDSTKAQVEMMLKLRTQEIQQAMKEAEMARGAEEAEADRVSRERVAAMVEQTKLIVAGMDQLGRQLSELPTRDNRAGP